MTEDLFGFIDDWKDGEVLTTGFACDQFEDNLTALTHLYHVDEAAEGFQHGFSNSTSNYVKSLVGPGCLLLTHANMKRTDRKRPIIAVDEVLTFPEWSDMYFWDGTYHGQFWAFFVDRIAYSPWGVGGFFSDLLNNYDLKQTDDHPFTSLSDFDRSPMNKGKPHVVVPKQ